MLKANEINGSAFSNVIENAIEKSNEGILAREGDYEIDGILHCGKCHTPKQKILELLGAIRKPMCLCKCEADRANEKARKEQIEMLRARCIPDASMRSYTFENDDKQNTGIIDIAKEYVENFDENFKNGRGLVLFGGTGCGKTYASVCIANALIDKGKRCKLTSFPQISREWEGMYGKKEDYLIALNANDILIIDDLGVERDSPIVYEMMYAVIDSRSRAKKPLIITTNLTSDEIKNTIDKRIISRLYEMCDFKECKGNDRRAKALIDRHKKAVEK